MRKIKLFINDKTKEFTYDYDFKSEGLYKIKYKFKKLMTSTNFMFINEIH